ncbi:tripartite tricarboxylate transporter TctB family protein [Cellulosilyticum sp. I15G10I2]|uniref:tripartite tricarboxylate transporter TctB family protein n=1 Tax=Cellulosilyticum sp. I15G10I2 TaxID=1892843 RepID=UPI00085CDD9D|nr:tripartite tricarboxylate transporter TctB family protein [Cellulosilyticum sp. I15G10I2]
MADLFKLKIVYSTSHLIGPKIVGMILIILALIMVAQEIIKRRKEGRSFSFKGKKFFEENYDKLKFWGTLILFVLYILALELVGFLIASLIFIFLFNILFAGIKNIKSIAVSAAISIISSVSIWYIFGFLFNITLP